MNSKLSQEISQKIKSGQVKMKSKTIISAEHYFLIALIIILTVASLIFINFTFYTLAQNGSLEFLEFGFAGFWAVVENVPFPFIIWALISIILASLIYKNFDLSYKKPHYFFLTALGVLILGFASGFFAYNFNSYVHQNAVKFNIPIVKEAYEKSQTKNLNTNYGILAKITEIKPKYVVARASGGKILIIGNKNEENQSQITEVEIKPYELSGKFSPRFNDQYFEDVYENMLASHQAMMVYLENIKFTPGQIIKLIGTKIGDKFYPKQILPVKSANFQN
ncbi:MAG: hypothetical protein M1338_04340 [Patescibacteria group bacterium]|nr:hypothetical protein [Patescibacteria group bacterium]